MPKSQKYIKVKKLQLLKSKKTILNMLLALVALCLLLPGGAALELGSGMCTETKCTKSAHKVALREQRAVSCQCPDTSKMMTLGEWKKKGLKLFKEYCPERGFALQVTQGKSIEKHLEGKTDKGVCNEIHALITKAGGANYFEEVAVKCWKKATMGGLGTECDCVSHENHNNDQSEEAKGPKGSSWFNPPESYRKWVEPKSYQPTN